MTFTPGTPIRRIAIAALAGASLLLPATPAVSSSNAAETPPIASDSHGDASRLSLQRTIAVEGDGYLFNTASFDQDKVVSYGDYQYVGYWNADGQLMLARRHLSTNRLDRVAFNDRVSPRVDDPHRNIVLGISEADGRLHVSYDHHVDQLRYRYSDADFLTDPPATMSADDFSPRTNMLDDPSRETGVTYPRFIPDRTGNLYFMYRRGTSGAGNVLLHRYDADSGQWSRLGVIFTGEGVHPPSGSTTRNAYLDYPMFDEDNRLHVTWTYREEQGAGQAGNHDVHYAYSDDGGLTWQNNAGVTVADLPAGDPIGIGDPGLVVAKAPLNSWLMNQTAMTLGPDGQPHIYQQRSTIVVEDQALRNYHAIHYWRTPDGTWHEQYIDDTNLRQPGLIRGDILFDSAGDLHIYFGNRFVDGYWAARATKASGWTDWTTYKIADVSPLQPGDGNKYDRYRLERDGIVTVPAGISTPDGPRFELLEFAPRKNVPADPVELSVADRAESEVTIAWKHVRGAETFTVYRRAPGAGFTVVADRIGRNSFLMRGGPGAWVPGSHAYTDETAVPGQAYDYRVVAYAGDTVVSASNVVRAGAASAGYAAASGRDNFPYRCTLTPTSNARRARREPRRRRQLLHGPTPHRWAASRVSAR